MEVRQFTESSENTRVTSFEMLFDCRICTEVFGRLYGVSLEAPPAAAAAVAAGCVEVRTVTHLDRARCTRKS